MGNFKYWNFLVISTKILFLSQILSACSEQLYQINTGKSLSAIECHGDNCNSKNSTEPNVIDDREAICDPLKPGESTPDGGRFNGLKADLRSPKENSTPAEWYHLDFYFDELKADVISSEIYFSQINVPTRPFQEGFVTENGDKLKNNSDIDLIEFFALQFKSELSLKPNLTTMIDTEEYEFAFISDDGIRFKLDGSIYLQFPEQTAQRMTCATSQDKRWVTLSTLTKTPIEIQYSQGPRTEIALVALWRKKSAALLHSEANDLSFCRGIQKFFNTKTSAPLEEWNALLAKGWEVIPHDVFFLPGHAENPCNNK